MVLFGSVTVRELESARVSCVSDQVFPRPVHVWSGRDGVTLVEEELDLTMLEGTHLVSATSSVTITGLAEINNNSRVSCTVIQYRR